MIPNNARTLRITAAAGTELASASSGAGQCSSPLTAVYIPKDFFLHAASLRQACAHCGIFVAAATRRCPGSVSVPMWRATLSRPLPVVALVGRYPTNKLRGHGPIPERRSLCPPHHAVPRGHRVLPALSQRGRSPAAIPVSGVRCPCITHPFAANRAPEGTRSARLACLSHAASVRSEPGSNSSLGSSVQPAGPKPDRMTFEPDGKALTLASVRMKARR